MAAPRKNYRRAVRLYERGGYSIAQIAAVYGIDAAAMYRILKRRGVKFRPRTAPRREMNDEVRA
jgi:transposase-like protein